MSTHSRSLPLDLLRTFAIFLVFTSHFRIFAKDLWFGQLGDFGWVGVDLFFVLSGYLISTQLFKEIKRTGTLSFKNFYIRRGFRIWPNYFFVLAIYFMVPAVIERGQLAPLWKFLTFTQNFDLNFTVYGAFSHAWSLCVEEQFYLVLPVLLIFLVPRLNTRKTVMVILGIYLLGLIIRHHAWMKWVAEYYFREHRKGMYGVFYREVYYPTYCRLDSLATGVGIAALKYYRADLWSKFEKYGNLFLFAACTTLAAAFFIAQDEYGLVASSIGYTVNALAFGLFLMAALSSNGFLANFRAHWVTVSANLAFAFYLTHKSMIHFCKQWFANWGLDPGSILYPLGTLVFCLITSSILYFAIEKPFLRWRDRQLLQNP